MTANHNTEDAALLGVFLTLALTLLQIHKYLQQLHSGTKKKTEDPCEKSLLNLQ
jgi:hypothetical protein